jgi:predicted nucleic acid-binding protein
VRGWLLDTNVVAALINPQGAPSVKRWAEGQDETSFHISVLTLAEYDKGIHNLPDDHPDRPLQGGARCAGGAVRSSRAVP